MARRAPPGSRLKVEAVLAGVPFEGRSMLDAVQALAKALGVTPTAWQEDPNLQLVGEGAAAAAMLRTLLDEGSSRADGILTVAARLDLNERTVAHRLRRVAREPAEPPTIQLLRRSKRSA